MKIFTILCFILSFSAFAYPSLDVIQKNCQINELSEKFNSGYYMGSLVYSCKNQVKVKLDYQNKLFQASVIDGDKVLVIKEAQELALVQEQMSIFYKDSNEYEIKKRYEYKLPVTNTSKGQYENISYPTSRF